MGVWAKLGKAGFTAAKGGRRLHQASREAERAGADPLPADEVGEAGEAGEIDAQLSLPHAVLLVRYISATLLLDYLQLAFLLKYLLLIVGVALVLLDVVPVVGIALIVLFLLAAIVQWLISRVIRRLGAVDRLTGLDDIAADATTVWWPNLKRELVRVGERPRARTLLKLGAGYAAGRVSGQQESALEQIDWLAVLPRAQWHDARRVLASATGDQP